MFDWNEYPWTARPDQLRRNRLKNLLLVTLAGWVSYFLGINLTILKLNKIIVPVINLPLGFYLAVQGSIVMFVIFLFWFAKYQRIANGNYLPSSRHARRRRPIQYTPAIVLFENPVVTGSAPFAGDGDREGAIFSDISPFCRL